MSQTPPPGDPKRRRYYDEAASWAADVHGSLRASRRIAWIVAGAATLVAVLEAVALAALTPLKTVVPLPILVDRQTGYVEAQSTLAPGALSQDQAVTQSNLVRYVTARESFDATDLREDYREVMLWSAGEARAQYARLMQKTTPDSPLNLYTPTTQVAVTIESISLLTPTTALVRFYTTRDEGGGAPATPRYWAAAIAFRYTNAPMSMADRFLDPLGFQVTRYRRDSETPVAGAAAPPAAVFAPSAPPAFAAQPGVVAASPPPLPRGPVAR
jgi:type IV secretion system protein VirB8